MNAGCQGNLPVPPHCFWSRLDLARSCNWGAHLREPSEFRGAFQSPVSGIVMKYRGKGKVMPETGLGDLLGCETSRLPYFLDNGLTDGGEDVSLTRRPAAPLTPQENSWYSFLLEAESTAGP
jgi:hypothetical protein